MGALAISPLLDDDLGSFAWINLGWSKDAFGFANAVLSPPLLAQPSQPFSFILCFMGNTMEAM